MIKNSTKTLIVGLVCFLMGAWLRGCTDSGRAYRPKANGDVCDTVVVRDTLKIMSPAIAEVRDLGCIAVKLPVVSDTAGVTGHSEAVRDTVSSVHPLADSVTVQVPIAQQIYESADYKAWVSGYRASLDSIEVYPKHEIVTIKNRQKRWHIGASAGYGYTPQGFQPYVGIGITYSILGF